MMTPIVLIAKKVLKFILPHGLVLGIQRRRSMKDAIFERLFNSVSTILADGRFACSWDDRWVCMGEDVGEASFDAHYIYHPAWAARRIATVLPRKHVDISSSLSFVTMLSAFVPVEFYDYRPASIKLNGLFCRRADLTHLPFGDGSIESLSCMHVVEHIGLGRYGDAIDPKGDLKAIGELIRVLAPGGRLYFVVPMGGNARIQFNAHRIYSYEMIISAFESLNLEDFSLIGDNGTFQESATTSDVAAQEYGCGCFLFRKAD